MNPIGDESGILAIFGVQALPVLLVAYRTRASRHPVVVGTIVSVISVMVLYVALALLSLLIQGTRGYQFATWLVYAIAGGLLPASVVGLVEGFVASLTFRLLG